MTHLPEQPVIQFKKLHDDAIIPTKGTSHAAGYDLYALEETVIIGGAGNVLVPTGIAVQLPEGTYGRIAMRSGHAVKQHLNVSAGVIDQDYTGGLGVVVHCTRLFNPDQIVILKTTACTAHANNVSYIDVKTAYENEPGIVNMIASKIQGRLVDYTDEPMYPHLEPHVCVIKKGERFAQLIPEKVAYPSIKVVTEFEKQYDPHLGYGSTGKGV